MMSKILSSLSLMGVMVLMGYEYLQTIDAQQKIQFAWVRG